MRYVVTHTLTERELSDHIARVGGIGTNDTISILDETAKPISVVGGVHRETILAQKEAKRGGTGMPRGPRGPRGSKVNTAVLTAMAAGPANVAAMKASLEAAGMAASSLSTALAMLQKKGEIERVGDGLYQRVSGALAAE